MLALSAFTLMESIDLIVTCFDLHIIQLQGSGLSLSKINLFINFRIKEVEYT